MRKIGLDVGDRTIGVAVSDPLGITSESEKTPAKCWITSESMNAT